jgi:hypothetical protein
LIIGDTCRWMTMATTLAPPMVCAECGEQVEPSHNGELLHVDTDRIHCVWPRPALWRRIARRV